MDGTPTWMAYEGTWNADSGLFEVRQAVFKSTDTTILSEGGRHVWQMNNSASKTAEAPCALEDWQGDLGCITKNVMHSGV